MRIRIALLRGINVGGRNVLPMAEWDNPNSQSAPKRGSALRRPPATFGR